MNRLLLRSRLRAFSEGALDATNPPHMPDGDMSASSEPPSYNRYWVPRMRPAPHRGETSIDDSEIYQPGPDDEVDEIPRPHMHGFRRLERRYSKYFKKTVLEDGTLFFRFPPMLQWMSLAQHKMARERREIPFGRLPFRIDYPALTPAQMDQVRQLSLQDPISNEPFALAKRFNTSPEFCFMVRKALPRPQRRITDLRYERQLKYWREVRERQLALAFPGAEQRADAEANAYDLRKRVTPFNWTETKPFSLEPTPSPPSGADVYRGVSEGFPDFVREATFMRGVEMLHQVAAAQREHGLLESSDNADVSVAGTASSGQQLDAAAAAEWRGKLRLADSFDYVSSHITHLSPWLTPKYHYHAKRGRVVYRNPLREAFSHQQTTGKPLYYHEKTL